VSFKSFTVYQNSTWFENKTKQKIIKLYAVRTLLFFNGGKRSETDHSLSGIGMSSLL